ncbi:MAG: alpha/beta hydrolase [Polyangiales bacterium]
MWEAPEYLGARAPERDYDFDSDGQRLRLHEWGDPSAVPIVLCHGTGDHARGFDLLAPLLADDFRVIAIDSRGHGDSGWVDNYELAHDVSDVSAVLRRIGRAHLLGHGRGGVLAAATACHVPELTRKVINIEGFGSGTAQDPLPAHVGQPASGTTAALALYLDGRRGAHRYVDWPPSASLDDLVASRRRHTPRLSDAWLRYFCWHGSRRSHEGVRWKVDPLVGFGAQPHRPEWLGRSWSNLHRPMLAIIAEQPDRWGPLADAVLDERLSHAPDVRRARVPQTGHYPHVEEPKATAKLIREFLGA